MPGASISEALPPLLPKTLAAALGSVAGSDGGDLPAAALLEAVEAQGKSGVSEAVSMGLV